MIQSWSLEIQRQLPGNTLVTVGYVGSHGTHLIGYNIIQFNTLAQAMQYQNTLNATVPISTYYSGTTASMLQQVYGTSSLARSLLLKQFPFYTGSVGVEAGYAGSSIYHALNLRIEKKYSHGLNYVVAYTWSKKMATTDTGSLEQFVSDPVHGALTSGGRASLEGAGFDQGYGYQDPQKQDVKMLAEDDVPQMFNGTIGYELPVGKGKAFMNQGGVLNTILGNWRLSGNFNASSGIPLTITGPCSALQSAISGSCTPDLVGPTKFSGSRTKAQRIQQWINPAGLAPAIGTNQTFWANYTPNNPAAWVFGNATSRAPGGIFSPGFWNLDTTLLKNFRLREDLNMEFRWELFNTLNHQNLGQPNTGYCLPPTASGGTDIVHQSGCIFGAITNVQTDPRTMEFGLKFIF
jgi:hypothetical protein